jgi:hypothetical protein
MMIQPGGQHPLSPSSQVRAHRCPNSSVERTSHAVPTFKDDEAAGIVPVDPEEDRQVPDLITPRRSNASAFSDRIYTIQQVLKYMTDLMTVPETIEPAGPSTFRVMRRVKSQTHNVRRA